MQLPAAAANALSIPQSVAAPPIATQCFMLSNMFDPSKFVFSFLLIVFYYLHWLGKLCFDSWKKKKQSDNIIQFVTRETVPNWEVGLRDEVIEGCKDHGGVIHIFVDKNSAEGNIYVKCPTVASAAASVNALHGRYFAGRTLVF